MMASWRVSLTPTPFRHSSMSGSGFCCRTNTIKTHVNGDQNEYNNNTEKEKEKEEKKKVVIVGSGWAGLGAAHHLCKQGFDVTVLDGGDDGLASVEDVCLQGFWYPYQNIFSLVDELGIKPFTNWTKSAQYSEEGLEVEFPIFQDLPQLPTPLGTLYYSRFNRLPLADRLTLLPLMAAVVDFDNTDTAWKKYDPISARELFRQFGCSERLYRDVIGPLLQVGLFAPPEQCSAAATLGILYYLILAHQKNFDVVWCRGKLQEKIFEPWMDIMRSRGCEFQCREVTDLVLNEETGCIAGVVCGKTYTAADAVILAVGTSTLQELIKNSSPLRVKEEFLKVLNLSSIDVLSVKLRLNRKVTVPNASNACCGYDDSFAWTFFDLNRIHDEHKDNPVTVLQADFYHANELLPLRDDQVLAEVKSCLSKCIREFDTATVMDFEIKRSPKVLTHFFPGSYKYMMRGSTSFPNLFMAGDWITTRHGSWSQEKSYVTGLEAANRVIDYLEDGSFAKIIAVEEDEPHIEAFRSLNRRFNEIKEQLPLASFFL